MPGTIARGREAMQKAIDKNTGGSGTFRPFLPAIFWKADKEEHYLLILTEVTDMPCFEMVQFIETENGWFQETVAKTDQFFEEPTDAFVEQWDASTRDTNIAIAVELEPVVEVVEGRKKPTGFAVKTTEYTRRIVVDGEVTDDEEEVIAPVIGYIAQSPKNFFNHVDNYDAKDAPITSTAVKVTRLRTDKDTSYTLQGYDGQKIDLTNLVEYVDGISYLRDEMDDLVGTIDEMSDHKAALYVGDQLLEKRILELTDDERYQELLAGVNKSMDKWGKKKDKKARTKGSAKKARPARSARREIEAVADEPAEAPDEDRAKDKSHMAELRERARAKKAA